jgi:hypothetical protein
MSYTDLFFALVAIAAVACFGTLITFQVMEVQYYEEAPMIWRQPIVVQVPQQ